MSWYYIIVFILWKTEPFPFLNSGFRFNGMISLKKLWAMKSISWMTLWLIQSMENGPSCLTTALDPFQEMRVESLSMTLSITISCLFTHLLFCQCECLETMSHGDWRILLWTLIQLTATLKSMASNFHWIRPSMGFHSHLMESISSSHLSREGWCTGCRQKWPRYST